MAVARVREVAPRPPIHSSATAASRFAFTSREKAGIPGEISWRAEPGTQETEPPHLQLPVMPQLQPYSHVLPHGLTLAGKVNSWIRVTRRVADSPARRDHPSGEQAEAGETQTEIQNLQKPAAFLSWVRHTPPPGKESMPLPSTDTPALLNRRSPMPHPSAQLGLVPSLRVVGREWGSSTL